MVEYTDLPPDAAELIQRQYDIDRADSGPKAPVSGFRFPASATGASRSRAGGLSWQSWTPCAGSSTPCRS